MPRTVEETRRASVIRNYRQIGIPLTEVGERLKQLNEAVKACDMAIKADSDLKVEISRNETALGCTLTVYFFNKEEENAKL